MSRVHEKCLFFHELSENVSECEIPSVSRNYKTFDIRDKLDKGEAALSRTLGRALFRLQTGLLADFVTDPCRRGHRRRAPLGGRSHPNFERKRSEPEEFRRQKGARRQPRTRTAAAGRPDKVATRRAGGRDAADDHRRRGGEIRPVACTRLSDRPRVRRAVRGCVDV